MPSATSGLAAFESAVLAAGVWIEAREPDNAFAAGTYFGVAPAPGRRQTERARAAARHPAAEHCALLAGEQSR